MSDEADKLNIKALPIPTEQRLDVFIVGPLGGEGLKRWESQAGTSNFWRWHDWLVLSKRPADFCGIVLFVTDPDGSLDARKSELLQPFYDRAGSEANCFQYQPIENNFVRRGLDWFNERRTK